MGRLGHHAGFLALLLTIPFLLFGCTREKVPAVGAPAADFLLKNLDGQELSLSQFRGNVVVIDFWATWCPPCKASIPHLIDIYRRYRQRGVVILGILVEPASSSAISQFVAETGINYPVLMGNKEVIDDYKVYQIPVTIVVDKEGIIKERLIGFSDATMRRLEERIIAVL